jgi:hypothetical protein
MRQEAKRERKKDKTYPSKAHPPSDLYPPTRAYLLIVYELLDG